MKEDLLLEINSLIEKINIYHDRYGSNDIRSSFLDGYFQIFRTYYSAYFHLDSDDILDKYHEIYPTSTFSRDDLTLHLQGHKNLLNSFLIINCWSNFELFITLFSEAILTEDQITELKRIDYDRLRKILKKFEIDETTEENLKKFIKSHIAHSPVINKYGKIFKLITSYPANRNKKSDREFLDFFGKLRNCIHSNYIYFGNNTFRYTYLEETFVFEPGKLISHSPAQENSIFRISQNLLEIGKIIIENIEFNNVIYDPSIELLQK